jgi:hypothetical protein
MTRNALQNIEQIESSLWETADQAAGKMPKEAQVDELLKLPVSD